MVALTVPQDPVCMVRSFAMMDGRGAASLIIQWLNVAVIIHSHRALCFLPMTRFLKRANAIMVMWQVGVVVSLEMNPAGIN
jgi:hypothetical protein